MKTNAVRPRRRLTQALIAVLCALGVVTAVPSAASASSSFSVGSGDGDVWGTVTRLSGYKVKIDAGLYRDTNASIAWQACWGYTEYGAYYNTGCSSLMYNGGGVGTTRNWTGLTYECSWARIGYVEIRLVVNGNLANAEWVWP